MVLAHPHRDAGLANVTVARHLGADRSEHWVVLLTLRVSRANQSDVNKGHQVLVVALVLKQRSDENNLIQPRRALSPGKGRDIQVEASSDQGVVPPSWQL